MEHLKSRLNEMSIGSENNSNENKWGWSLKDLYRHGLNFYKGTH